MKSKVYYGEYSLEHWMNLILKKSIILPDYQRLFVWNKENTQKLIESIAKNEFVPPVTIGSYDNGSERENLILDGQQRLTSIFLSFLGIFPNKEKYKKTIEKLKNESLASEDDNKFDVAEFDDVLEWSLRKLTEKGTSKNQILSQIKPDNYDDIPGIDINFLRNHYLGFSFLVPQMESGESQEDFYSEQQKYYSSVFRNINIQGEKLLPQESRKSLYFLKDTLVDFFEPEFTKDIKVNDARMDFVRYLALIAHWIKVENINKVGYSYAKKMEKLYEEFIIFLAYDSNSGKDIFGDLPEDIVKGEYASKLDSVELLLKKLSNKITFPSIIDMDLAAFGLIRAIIFENKTTEMVAIDSLVNNLKAATEQFKADANHIKNPSALRHLRNRMSKSYEIYRGIFDE